MEAFPKPKHRQIGIFTNFLSDEEHIVIVRRHIRLFHPSRFEVIKPNGEIVMTAEAEWCSMSSRLTFSDAAGSHLFDTRRSFGNVWAEDSSGHIFMRCERNKLFLGSKRTVTFTSNSGQEETLLLRRQTLENDTEIIDSVSRVRIGYLRHDTFSRGVPFTLIVGPNVDLALMVALSIAIDGFDAVARSAPSAAPSHGAM